VWLCLSLAVLFLYNPFVTAPASGLGFNVSHSASNRATVGASELQHFKANESQGIQVGIIEPAGRLGLVDRFMVERSTAPELQVHIPRNVFLGSWWFRPPPAA
jgi:hypothetical protein